MFDHDHPQSKDPLIEYLSRPTRMLIVQHLCEALVNEWNENVDMGAAGLNHGGRPPSTGAVLLASRLGVSRKSVDRWLNGEMQSSNRNAEKLLWLGLEYIPDLLIDVLWESVECHRKEVQALLIGHRNGALRKEGRRQ